VARRTGLRFLKFGMFAEEALERRPDIFLAVDLDQTDSFTIFDKIQLIYLIFIK
jgi:hypothetical protein